MEEKSVLIIGGGVAALSAAAALVEQNKKNSAGVPRFKITIATSDDVWGGRASSWKGGDTRYRYERDSVKETPRTPGSPKPTEPSPYSLHAVDFRFWPPTLPLNHGFHAVFDESTYVNFWYTLRLAGLLPELLKGTELISNEHEILVYETVKMNVCRLPVKKLPWPLSLIPANHLALAALELWRHGGWSLGDVYNFGTKVMKFLNAYGDDFDALSELDQFERISFEKWCRDRGVHQEIFNKMMFKFLFQGTYIAPNTMDATSGLMGLWTILRHVDAARWYYINGGITEKLMNPIAEMLAKEGVELLTQHELDRFQTEDGWYSIDRCELSSPKRSIADEQARRFDYFISTLPLDSSVEVFKRSTTKSGDRLLDVFPDVSMLEKDIRFPDTAGTVNLQAWFNKKGLLSDKRKPKGDYRNVIAGLEPLCVMIDYKNVLPMYQGQEFPGSVLEINGSLQELQKPEHYGYFECDPRFGEPMEAKTIEFAKSIMIDLARRYGFPELKKAVEEEDFLICPDWPGRTQWKGQKVPPFLWKNSDPYNRFFVTGPGTLRYRPWVWRDHYPEEHIRNRKAVYNGPKGYPKNFFIAGDWTRNGFDTPCMEGASRSGRMAALATIRAALSLDPTADPTAPTHPDPKLIDVFDSQ